MFTYKKSISEI